jgi:HPr kinase/phosphorylase
VRLVVETDPGVIELLDTVYEPLRTALGGDPGPVLRLDPGDFGPVVERVNTELIERLTERSIYAFHAATVSHRGQVVMLGGPSGAGKTTLALALAARGLGLLSDELALSLPDGRTIAPFPRRAMVRAGTIDLVAELAFLGQREPIGVEPRWPVGPEDLEKAFGRRPADAGPLGHVVLVEPGDPGGPSALDEIGTGLAAAELLHLTPAAATELELVMDRLGELLRGVRCARLRRGTLESSLHLLDAWLGLAV